MFYKEYQPPCELAPFIKCFWALEHDYSKEPMLRGERIWPDGHFELIMTFGNPYVRKLNGAHHKLPVNFLIGQFDTELLLDSPGTTALFAARFHAWGLYPFLRKPMTSFTNKLTDLQSIFGDQLKELQGSLRSQQKDQSIRKLTRFFLRRAPRIVEEDAVVKRLGTAIYEKRGVIRLDELMQQFEIGPRKIQRLFSEQVGISAKRFAKIIRFNEAKCFIEKDPHVNLAELTYACGYSDQPHFIRNFKELYGITPTEYKKRVMRFKTFLE